MTSPNKTDVANKQGLRATKAKAITVEWVMPSFN
jgi:hypothetical protein